jgi:hypothetical protein
VASYFLIESSRQAVEAWSTSRLQFEPKGWQREFRAALRDAVAAISPTGRLYAIYGSPDTSSCDAENILFYNVGLSCFARAAREGLQFERGYGVPPVPQSSGAPMQHYHRYERVSEIGEFGLWQPTAVLASFTDVVFARLDEPTRVAPIWKRIREAVPRTPVAWTSSWLGLHLVLRAPSVFRSSAAALLKPLIDGVVSGLHQHDGSRLDVVSEVLAGQLAVATDEVAALLTRSEGSVLGRRLLIVPRQNGVQWLPGDDACVACSLQVVRASARREVALDAVVLAVEPGSPPISQGPRRTGPALIFDQTGRHHGR